MAAIAPPSLEILQGNDRLLTEKELDLVARLVDAGQAHLFSGWPEPGKADEDKVRLVKQLAQLDSSYAGGLLKYISNAKQLLKESKEGTNPLKGCVPSVPQGERLDFGSPEFVELEAGGIRAAGETAFVLVAGGLGERLGYSGIKLALPVESASGTCFLQLYIDSILALQAASGTARKLELAIMTSDDTHARTKELLQLNDYFGADPTQIHLLKQEKVPCLSDGDARLALDAKDAYRVQTKPHGHGDVHMLLHSSGLAARWRSAGVRWVAFFQDTNGQVFRALPAALGVSVRHRYDVNSLAVPRRAKEAIGAITTLTFPDGSARTLNVEYNQLDPLLRATVNPEGDVNDDTGFSPFPGNINQLVLKLDTYCEELQAKGGVIAEFVNPKYADASRTTFKSSTRLECMMQARPDFPKGLPASAKVGYTTVNQVWAAYSPVKNSPADAADKAKGGNPSHSATSGELDYYETNCKARCILFMLRMVGVDVGEPTRVSYNGLEGLELWPRLVWTPRWALGFAQLKEKFDDPSKVHFGSDSALVISDPSVEIKSLDIKRGALIVSGPATLQSVIVDEQGWEWKALTGDVDATEEEQIRGFTVVRHTTKEIK